MVLQSLPLAVTMLMLALAVSAGTSAAQSPPEGRQARPAGQLTPNDVVVMLDNFAAVRAQEALTLDDAHYTTFVTRLRAFI